MDSKLDLAKALFLTGCICVLFVHKTSSGITRVPNTTLKLPPNPPAYGYTITNAFGSLTFARPVAILTPPGETNRLFVVEQQGLIAVITNLASPTRAVFLDLTDRVQYRSSEEGLLALAFHPGYATNRYFYVWYTLYTNQTIGSSTRHDRLSRFEADAPNPNQGLPASELVFINQADPADNHNGGDLHFGPDGYLYVSLGDGGTGSVGLSNAQRIDKDFFSGIIRIDVDKRPTSISANPHPANTNNASGAANYAIPPDNPFIAATSFNGQVVQPSSVRTEFWAVGLRNPWRITFDSETGMLYCADVGQNAIEEIDIIHRGANYGWPYREGSQSTGLGSTPPSGFAPTAPIQEYSHGAGTNEGNCIIGGVVYRGIRYPSLNGFYIFADNVSGNVWAMRYQTSDNATNVIPMARITTNPYITSFGIHPFSQDILLAVQGENRIKRLVQVATSEETLPPTLADTGAFLNLATLTQNPGIIPYQINVPFWSDGASKLRWFSVPDTNLTMGFDPATNWTFPTGTVWIKHFDLELTNRNPASAKRLETRFIIRNTEGVYGVTYRWDSLTNATLVPDEGLDESFNIHDGGTVRTQVWHYPSRAECLRCHTALGGFALGFNTPQLNRTFNYDASIENQLTALSQAGYLNTNVTTPQVLPLMAHATNTAFSVEHRVRSYLAANCVQCHQPGVSAPGYWDARFSTPLHHAGIINGALADDFGNVRNKVVAPGALQYSILYQRIAEFGSTHMPPLATSVLNLEVIHLLSFWITNMTTSGMSPNLQITELGAGSYRLTFDGIPETTYRVQYSEQLNPPFWQTLRSSNADSNGLFQVIDTPPANSSRYYRSAYP